MQWPIIIPQCKCAVDCLVFRLKTEFMPPETGPWPRWGYYWRWGHSMEESPAPAPAPIT